MNIRQCVDLLYKYETKLIGALTESKPAPMNLRLIGKIKLTRAAGRETALNHLRSMISDMHDFVDKRHERFDMDKFYRWLGFMQGVFWALGVYSLDELREHNRSSNK